MTVGSFGEFGIGGTKYGWGNMIVGNSFEPPSDGSMISILGYGSVVGVYKYFKCAIFDSNKNLLGSTAQYRFDNMVGWMECSFAGTQIVPITSGTTYWLLGWGQTGITEHEKTESGKTQIYESEGWGVWPGDLGSATTYANTVTSIYGKYDIPVAGQAFSYHGTESFSISDSAYGDITLNPAESLTIADAHTGTHDAVRNFSESLTISDSAVKSVVKNMTESLQFVDSILKDVTLNPTETMTISDSASIARDSVRHFTESLTISDSAALTKSIVIYVTEMLRIADTLKDFPRLANKVVSFTNKILGDDVASKFDFDKEILEDDVTKDDDT